MTRQLRWLRCDWQGPLTAPPRPWLGDANEQTILEEQFKSGALWPYLPPDFYPPAVGWYRKSA